MKPVVSFAFFLALVALCYAVSQPIIRDTRAEGCVEDSHCGSHCAWDGAKIFPGDQLNQPGKCRHLACTKEFDIRITPCPVDGEKNFKLPANIFSWLQIFSERRIRMDRKGYHQTVSRMLRNEVEKTSLGVRSQSFWILNDVKKTQARKQSRWINWQ